MKNSQSNSYLKNKNIQDGIVVFCLGAALAAYSQIMFRITAVPTEWKLSPYLFPMLISIFTVAMAVSLFCDGRAEIMHGSGSDLEEISAPQIKKVVVVVGMALVYYLMLNILSFIPATILFLIAMFLFLGERRYWLIGVLAAVTSASIYVIFGLLLNVRLP